MSDSFFEFDSNMPALGAGPTGNNNDLMECPEVEEDFDLLNDETFGNAEQDEDWEEHHEKLASNLQEKQPDLCKLQSQEEFMEQSISQLVVDDDDDLGKHHGHGHMRHSNAKPIPTKNSLDELFGPSSPPGILSAEQLVSHGPNIWGSPVRESYMPAKQDSLKELLKQLQKPQAPSHPVQVPGIMPPRQASGSLPNAKTVEELEQELIGKRGTPLVMTAEELEMELTGRRRKASSPPMMPPPYPIGTPPPGYPLGTPSPAYPIGTPPPGYQMQAKLMQRHSINGTHPPHLSADMRSQSLPSTGFHPQPPIPGSMRVSPPLMIVSPPPSMRHHTVAPPSVAARMSPVLPQQGRSPYSRAVTVGVIGPVVQKPPPLPPSTSPVNGSERSSPPDANGSYIADTPIRQRTGMPIPYSDPTHLRSSRGNQSVHPEFPQARQALFNQHSHPGQLTDRRPPHLSSQHIHRGHYPHPGRGSGRFYVHNHYDPGGGGDSRLGDVDDYAGLMTQREKDWIIKIQLLQLHTDNPYVDDFYFTTWMLQKMAKERQKKKEESESKDRKDDDEPKLIIPSLAKMEKNYRPVQFEGSLGRLTASSVHNPRQILDVKSTDIISHEESQKVREVRRFKQLLLNIEKGYDVLLDIDEMEKMAGGLPEADRCKLFEHRAQRISALVDCLNVRSEFDSDFRQVMSVRKGKKLLARVLPLAIQDDKCSIVQAVLRNLTCWTRKDQHEEVSDICLNVVCDYIQSCDVAGLLLQSRVLLSMPPPTTVPLLHTAISNKFGISVVWSMLHHMESLHQENMPSGDRNQQNEWLKFVKTVVESLKVVSCDHLPKIEGAFPLASKHMYRVIGPSSVATIDEILKAISAAEP